MSKLNRKEFLLKSAKIAGGVTLGGVTGGMTYTYFANPEYKKTFPHIPENHIKLPKNGKKVVIVGAGLAGLQAGCELSVRGFEVILLEKTGLAGGKLKTWKDQNFAKKHLGKKGYHREHGLHAIWGFYKNLREFIGRNNFKIKHLGVNDSFYYFVSNRGVESKITNVTWQPPFDRFQMLNRGVYVPSREDLYTPASNVFDTFLVSLKMWGFDFSNERDRLYLDSITFYDWARERGMSVEYIKHFFDALSEMGFFMTTKECSALAVVNFIKLGCQPSDARVDLFQWPPNESFIEPMVKIIEENGGRVLYNEEVSSIERSKEGKVTALRTNEHLPRGKVRRCRICGNIIGPGEVDHCPFCGAHHSEIQLVDLPISSYEADFFVVAGDVPGTQKFISTSRLGGEDPYFAKIQKLTTAHILCVNLLYENSQAWMKRFPEGETSAFDFMPTGFQNLGFTSNWSLIQIPELKEKNVDLIEVQVSNWKELIKKPYLEIAKIVHEELKTILPELPEFSEFYINHWDNYTGFRPGDEKNRPGIQSPIENLLFIGDWVFVDQHSVFMERTNVMAKSVTNLLLDKIGESKGKITILRSGTPDLATDLLKFVTTVT